MTAETHNFPSGVAPIPGAQTGVGGRLRDVQATGRGAVTAGGIAGYCVGNLRLKGWVQAWEVDRHLQPTNMGTPTQILLRASDGASDYANKFGEPLIAGFARAAGFAESAKDKGTNLDGKQTVSQITRREWLRPIMFSAGGNG